MKLWDELEWEYKHHLAGGFILFVGVPIVLVGWYYAVRALRYLLDGVIAWLLWIAKIAGIVLAAGGGAVLLAFNVYQFTYYRHVEPMATVVHFGTRYYELYCSACAAAQMGVAYGTMLYQTFVAPLF